MQAIRLCVDIKVDAILQGKAGAQWRTANAKPQLPVVPQAADAVKEGSAQGCGRSTPYLETEGAFDDAKQLPGMHLVRTCCLLCASWRA